MCRPTTTRQEADTIPEKRSSDRASLPPIGGVVKRAKGPRQEISRTAVLARCQGTILQFDCRHEPEMSAIADTLWSTRASFTWSLGLVELIASRKTVRVWAALCQNPL